MPGLAVGVGLFGTLEALFAFLAWFGAVFVQNVISALERVILRPFFGHLATFLLLRPRCLPFPVSRLAASSILLWQSSLLSLLIWSPLNSAACD